MDAFSIILIKEYTCVTGILFFSYSSLFVFLLPIMSVTKKGEKDERNKVPTLQQSVLGR